MQPFLLEHREEIAELCRRHHVTRLSVFGSAVRDDFDPAHSDVDLVVEFAPVAIEEYARNKWALLENLQSMLQRKVDLLAWKSLKNPFLRSEVESTQELLYAS